MTPEQRKHSLSSAASLTVVVVGWVMLVGAVLAWSGVATVKVIERGTDCGD